MSLQRDTIQVTAGAGFVCCRGKSGGLGGFEAERALGSVAFGSGGPAQAAASARVGLGLEQRERGESPGRPAVLHVQACGGRPGEAPVAEASLEAAAPVILGNALPCTSSAALHVSSKPGEEKVRGSPRQGGT